MQPLVAAALMLSVAVLGQPARPIFGIVVDSAGKGVANATVRIEIAGRPVGEGRTTLDGRFGFDAEPAGDVRLVASAPGFAPASVTLEDGASRTAEVTLQLTKLFEEVQVSPRTDLAPPDLDAVTMVFGSPPLRTRVGLTIDDALRMVPGFTLGSRSSSRVASPGSQGMSLRGLGGSGASRSVVLADGAPLNDVFAGGVSWDNVPQSAIDRIEVVRGGGDRYGVDAVGGLVEIVTVRPARASARALIEGGSLGTARTSLFIGGHRRGWSLSGAGEWFRTDGYVMVPKDERGLIDTPAGSKHRSAFGSVGYLSANGWRFDVRGTVFSGNRNNGTPAQTSGTNAQQASGDVSGTVSGGFLSLHVFDVRQQHRQRFTVPSAEPPRADELVDRIDYVPTRVVAVTSQWVRPLGRHSLVAGGEGRAINSTTEEMKLTRSGEFGTSTADGRQDFGSAFARATFVVSDRLTIAAGVRGDLWHSESEPTFVARNAVSFSPRVIVSRRRLWAGCARLGVPRLPRPHAPRALPRFSHRQQRDRTERSARTGEVDSRGGRTALQPRPGVGSGYRLLERARRRRDQRHGLDVAMDERSPASKRGQTAFERARVRRDVAAAAVRLCLPDQRHHQLYFRGPPLACEQSCAAGAGLQRRPQPPLRRRRLGGLGSATRDRPAVRGRRQRAEARPRDRRRHIG